jgi:hypothetical protein
MAVQLSVACRNAALDAIETAIGTFPVLKLFSGSAPANTAADDAGTLLATFSLTSDWAQAASNGAKSFSTIAGIITSALTSGTVGHYRLYSSAGVCHMQGTVTAPGDGGDMTIEETAVTTNRVLNVTSWTITDGNG